MTTHKTSRNWTVALLAAIALTVANKSGAQNLPAPVSGLEVLDLAGTPILSGDNNYTTNAFVATTTDSTVTFVFRHDPGFFTFDNPSITDITTLTSVPLVNSNFLASAPATPGGGAPGWTYFIQSGNLFPQFLGFENGSGWFDGATQAYDGIDQSFATVIGDTYDISFNLSETNNNGIPTPGNLYQQLSSNGDTTDTDGNGIDVVVYAGNGTPPTTVPEASSTFLMVLGGLSVLLMMAKSQQVKAAL
jgi:hypothetical protein